MLHNTEHLKSSQGFVPPSPSFCHLTENHYLKRKTRAGFNADDFINDLKLEKGKAKRFTPLKVDGHQLIFINSETKKRILHRSNNLA